MYRVTGWFNGGAEFIMLDSWGEVIALVSCLEEEMYQAILVINVITEKAVITFSRS